MSQRLDRINQEAKVFVSVLGGKMEPVLEKLAQGKTKIQAHVNKRITMRCTPVLSFRGDNSAERGVSIVNLLEEVDKLPTADREDEEE